MTLPPEKDDFRQGSLSARLHALSLRAFDLTRSDQESVLEDMFAKRRRDAVSYWVLLLLSMAIATVGLILGSAAVVIGAMLVSPLMGPIVELGMGLVIGSPVLTIRSVIRMTVSVLAVIGGAALLTILLPFNEMTAEIASRTSPTALDLLLAAFVAIVAAFTTARPRSDTTGAAAGTAISIALVPPLCVAGYGLGVQDPQVAGGATLLFLTNLTAILLVSVLFFLALGFEKVGIAKWEESALAQARTGSLLELSVHRLQALFGWRYGKAVRIGIPLLLVAAVFVPLSQALEQVAWEVRTRSAVARILERSGASGAAVQTQVSVTPGAVTARLYLVGSSDEASRVEADLVNRIAAATGVVPTVSVVVVPDAEAMLQAAARDAAPVSASADPFIGVRTRLDAALGSVWPADQLGEIVEWTVELPDSSRPLVTIRHLGPPAGGVADALLGQQISGRLGSPVSVRIQAFPPAPATAPAADGSEWLSSVDSLLASARGSERVFVCLGMPSAETLASAPGAAAVEEQLRERAEELPNARVVNDTINDRWSARFSSVECP